MLLMISLHDCSSSLPSWRRQLASLVETKVDFIWNNTRFAAEVYRHSPELFTIASNGSLAQVRGVLLVSPGVARVLPEAC